MAAKVRSCIYEVNQILRSKLEAETSSATTFQVAP